MPAVPGSFVPGVLPDDGSGIPDPGRKDKAGKKDLGNMAEGTRIRVGIGFSQFWIFSGSVE